MSIEAMKQALEAFEVATTPLARDRQEVLRAQAALRQAIEQAEEKNCKNCVIDKPCIAKGKDMQICGAFVPKYKDCGSSPHESHWGASSVTKPEYVAAQKEKTQRVLDKMAENARELGLDYEPVQAEKQEPVGVFRDDDDIGHVDLLAHQQMLLKEGDLLYTTPQPQEFVCSTGLCHYTQPQREWVSLTLDEIWEICKKHDPLQITAYARAIEKALKEKNSQ